jgi:hypothetical protein
MRPLAAIPSLGPGKPGGNDRINRPLGTVRSFLFFQALRARLLSLVPSSFVPPFHEKTRRRVDYGGQAGTNLCEATPLVASS